MNAVDAATARHRLYALLGRLVVSGLEPDTEPVVGELPALRGLLPRSEAHRDELAAAHHRALALELAPYESVFLGREAQLGGPIADGVRAFAASVGLAAPRPDVEPDHLGVELAILAHLCAWELEALQDDREPEVERSRALQRTFLDEHLLRWLPAVAAAVRGLQSPWSAVTGLALELAASHREALGGEAEPWSLPEPPPLLEDPRTGLRDIARVLATPALCGWTATRHGLSRIGRSAELGTGFGDRRQQLVTLLGGAAEADRLPELVWALSEGLDHGEGCLSCAADLGLEAHVRPWRDRLAWTREQLEALQEAAAELAAG